MHVHMLAYLTSLSAVSMIWYLLDTIFKKGLLWQESMDITAP